MTLKEPYMVQFYRTQDQEQAILLYAIGRILDSQEWQGEIAYFLFENREACEEAISDYHKGKITLNAKDFFDAYRTIKNILRSR